MLEVSANSCIWGSLETREQTIRETAATLRKDRRETAATLRNDCRETAATHERIVRDTAEGFRRLRLSNTKRRLGRKPSHKTGTFT